MNSEKENPKCTMCGYRMSQHEIEPATGDQTVCPIHRQESNTPPMEHSESPRGDY